MMKESNKSQSVIPYLYQYTCVNHLTNWIEAIMSLHFFYVISNFGRGRVAHLFSFLCCGFYFVCLRPVSCVPNVSSFLGTYILDCPFGFLLHLINLNWLKLYLNNSCKNKPQMILNLMAGTIVYH
jgi:hypothetical protein